MRATKLVLASSPFLISVKSEIEKGAVESQEYHFQQQCMSNGICQEEIYGLDVSWPNHHQNIHNASNPLGDRQKFYLKYLHGCYKKFDKESCDLYEESRLMANRRQPLSVLNFTEFGFTKTRAPLQVFELIRDFWEENKHLQIIQPPTYGDTMINRWDIPSYLLDLGNTSLKGGGYEFRKQIGDFVSDVIRDWTGVSTMKLSACFGIRVYKRGSILTSHVDKLPYVTGAIINIDQEVDENEPWPLEIYAHDGKAYNVSLNTGDMLLFESHSIIHGRPFPLKGNFFANVMLHFTPTQTNEKGLPFYIMEGSPEDLYHKQHDTYKELLHFDQAPQIRVFDFPGNTAARENDITLLQYLLQNRKEKLYVQDQNGWTPLHDAAYSCNIEAIRFLIHHEADLHSKNKKDLTPLGVAIYHARCKGQAQHYLTLTILLNPRYSFPREAAQVGDVLFFQNLQRASKDALYQRDHNGWSFVHEAARKGHLELIKFFLDFDEIFLHQKTKENLTPLDCAKLFLNNDHEVIQYLTSRLQ